MTKDLEVRHCRALVAVHGGGGVGAAAKALGVAQSTVSETLLSLERLLGGPVTLRRPGREAVLTAAAEALLPHARSLIAASEAALAAGARQIQGTVRLGTVESISSFLLPGPLSDVRLLWPHVEVQVTMGLCDDLRKRVARSELDAALTIEGNEARDPGDGRESWPAHLRLVVAADHPLAHLGVARRDLAARTFLLSDFDGAFNNLMRIWIGDVDPAPRLESAGSTDGVKRGVLNSAAVGVLPDYAVADEISAGLLVALDTHDPLPSVSLRLTSLTVPPAGSPLEGLIARIRKMFPTPAG
jgi:DNA-binding transcriptional LysR family regulator